MSHRNGYILEASRHGRQVNRWRLNQSVHKYEIPEGHIQAMVPYAWLRDPIEPEERRVFHVSMREAFSVALHRFDVNTLLIAHKLCLVFFQDNRTNVDHDAQKKAADDYDAKRSKESHDKEDAEHKWMSDLVENNEPAGQDQEIEDSRIKFFVLLRHDISEGVLTSFLETIPDESLRQKSYSYVFPLTAKSDAKQRSTTDNDESSDNGSTSSDQSQARSDIMLADKTRFMREILENESDESQVDEDQAQDQGSQHDDGHLSQGSEVESSSTLDSGSASGSASGSTSSKKAASITNHRSLARYYLSHSSPLKNNDLSTIHDSWLQLIKPFSEVPSFYAMHAYIILDEQTAVDGETVLVVSDTDGIWRQRRIDFPALKEGIVLKGLETLIFDLDQLPGDWSGVVRGPVMPEAQRLEALEKEREAKLKERYYKKHEKDVEGSPAGSDKERKEPKKKREQDQEKNTVKTESDNSSSSSSKGKQDKSWKHKFKWGKKKSSP